MRICIDPGHSALDPGIIGLSGLTEADMSLHFALLLKQYLNTLGHEVILTRTDEQVEAESPAQDLKRRGSLARYIGCQLLVSIHGTTATAGSGGVAVQYLQGEGLSARLAVAVYKQMQEKAALAGRGVVATSVINLFKRVQMPAIQVELALFGDQHLEVLLQDADWLNTAAQACGEAIAEWHSNYWLRLAMGESQAREQPQTTTADNAADQEEQVEEPTTDVAAENEQHDAESVENAQTAPAEQNDSAASKSKTIAPIAVQARMADGTGMIKQITEAAQARLDALSKSAMERFSKLTATPAPNQAGVSGVKTRLTVSIPPENAVPKPRTQTVKSAETNVNEGRTTNLQSNKGIEKRSGVAIPVPVTHSRGAGTRVPFRASAVVQTSSGRTPVPVQVNVQAKGQARDKTS